MRGGVRKAASPAGGQPGTDFEYTISLSGSSDCSLPWYSTGCVEGLLRGQADGSGGTGTDAGSAPWADRLHSKCGGGSGGGDDVGSIERNGSVGRTSGDEQLGSCTPTGTGEGDEASWIFSPVTEEEEKVMEFVNDCPGGICPVPWAVDTSDDDAFDDALSSKFQEDKIQEYMRPRITDEVNHPDHYTTGSIECIEAIEAQLTEEEFRGYLKGNVAKYMWRERHKGGTQSLEKAHWYLNRLLSMSED